MRLKDKIALITGAGTGIGEAIAHKFAREGARLVLNGLPHDPVPDVAAAIAADGGQAEVYLGDVSEAAAAQACVDLAIQRFGRLDVLVNNAGIFIALAETDDYRIEDFDRTVRHNLRPRSTIIARSVPLTMAIFPCPGSKVFRAKFPRPVKAFRPWDAAGPFGSYRARPRPPAARATTEA